MKALRQDRRLAGTQELLTRSEQEQYQYKTVVAGKEFIVVPGVFSPKYFLDTEIFALHLPMHTGARVLEIGAGTGAIAITAAFRGANKVVATDINPLAVQNTMKNIQLHDLNTTVEARSGDMYEPIGEGEKFDVIFWNTPFGFVENKTLSMLERAVFNPRYSAVRKYVKGAKNHLTKSGKLFIGFSSTIGRFDLLEKICRERGYSLDLVHEEWSTEVIPVKFEIYEIRK